MGVSLAKPGFSLGEIEAVLGEMFGVHPAKRAAFSARLQQLQRLGVPSGANPGRGKRFRYQFWQVAEFALCVDLLDAGIPPNLIKIHFSGPGVYGLSGMGQKIEAAPANAAEGIHLFLELHALGQFRSANEQIREEHAADHIMKFRTGPSELMSDEAVTPTIAINLSKRLDDLKKAVAKVIPSLVDEATFPPLQPRPGTIV